MSDVPDLGKIKPSESSPPEQPDQRTAAEDSYLKRKPPTPTESLAASHLAHIESYKVRIEYHCGENERLRAEIDAIRRDLDGSRQREKDLAVRCKQLETASEIAGGFNLLGIVLTIAGPCLLGYAGSSPGLTDAQKYGYCAGGGALTVCGILVLLIAYLAVWWHKPSKESAA